MQNMAGRQLGGSAHLRVALKAWTDGRKVRSGVARPMPPAEVGAIGRSPDAPGAFRGERLKPGRKGEQPRKSRDGLLSGGLRHPENRARATVARSGRT